MRKIPLTQGYSALVDDDDFEWLNQHKWCASREHRTVYARRKVKGKTIRMHRAILNAKPGEQGDHRDGNGLDNQRSNLRLCTHTQNIHNQRIPKNNTSGYKGVHWNKPAGKWLAKIIHNNKLIHLGLFTDLAQAAHAYDVKAKELFGEFARLNFANMG